MGRRVNQYVGKIDKRVEQEMETALEELKKRPKRARCELCGEQFVVEPDKLYRVIRQDMTDGRRKKILYDACDCPICGDRVIIQEVAREGKKAKGREKK